MKNSASLLHLLLCKSRHASDIKDMENYGDDRCRWYLEEQIEDSWGKQDHIVWLHRVKKLQEFSYLDEEELYSLLQKIMKIIEHIDKIGFTDSLQSLIVRQILMEYLTPTSATPPTS